MMGSLHLVLGCHGQNEDLAFGAGRGALGEAQCVVGPAGRAVAEHGFHGDRDSADERERERRRARTRAGKEEDTNKAAPRRIPILGFFLVRSERKHP